MKPRPSPHRISPPTHPRPRSSSQDSLGGVGGPRGSKRVPGERRAEVQRREQRPNEGSRRARLPGGGPPHPAPSAPPSPPPLPPGGPARAEPELRQVRQRFPSYGRAGVGAGWGEEEEEEKEGSPGALDAVQESAAAASCSPARARAGRAPGSTDRLLARCTGRRPPGAASRPA